MYLYVLNRVRKYVLTINYVQSRIGMYVRSHVLCTKYRGASCNISFMALVGAFTAVLVT